jgi:dipeptide transport system ATP-binding protein
MVMYFGEVVERGSRDEVFADPKHAYTKTLFAATPRADVESIRRRLELRGKSAATVGP